MLGVHMCLSMATELFFKDSGLAHRHFRQFGRFDYVIDFRLGGLLLILFESQLWAVECLGKGKSLLIFDGLELVKID